MEPAIADPGGTFTIQSASLEDFDLIWPILHDILAAGETYAWDEQTTCSEAQHFWMQTPLATFVARSEPSGTVIGSYFLKPNQPGRGAHVANAGYIVGRERRGQGIGRALCLHSLNEAKARGFRAMQFNLVVSTNKHAVALWESCGFRVVGTIPQAFLHPTAGYVPALIMHQSLL